MLSFKAAIRASSAAIFSSYTDFNTYLVISIVEALEVNTSLSLPDSSFTPYSFKLNNSE
jgi:hypothetical protein